MPNKEINTAAALRIAASKAAQDPQFLGYVLKLYCHHEGLNEDLLAERLGTEVMFLPRLYLCKRPPTTAVDFAARVGRIADYALIDAAALAAIIRQVDALQSLSDISDSHGLLAAARDADEEVVDDQHSDADEE